MPQTLAVGVRAPFACAAIVAFSGLTSAPAQADPNHVAWYRHDDCTVVRPQNPVFRGSFASAFRCRRDFIDDVGYVGESNGVAAMFKTLGSRRIANCATDISLYNSELRPLNCRANTRASVTMQLKTQFYKQGQERLTAAVQYNSTGSPLTWRGPIANAGGGLHA